MKSFKPFLYVIYTLMFLSTVLLIFSNDSLMATFDQSQLYRFWMWWALAGYVLLMLESVFENVHLSRVRRGQDRLTRENLELKAKLYDRYVAGDTLPPVPPRNRPDDGPDQPLERDARRP